MVNNIKNDNHPKHPKTEEPNKRPTG